MKKITASKSKRLYSVCCLCSVGPTRLERIAVQATRVARRATCSSLSPPTHPIFEIQNVAARVCFLFSILYFPRETLAPSLAIEWHNLAILISGYFVTNTYNPMTVIGEIRG